MSTTTAPAMVSSDGLTGDQIGRWHPVRAHMEVEAQVVRALRARTTGMRAMGTVFLPRDQREKEIRDEYIARLLRTFLFPAYDEAVANIAGRPFQRAIELKDGELLPEPLQKLENNADRAGTSLTEFARQRLLEMADRGIAHILVDSPPNVVRDPLATGGTRRMRLDEADRSDARPYFVAVSADQLVNWAWRRDATGLRVLQWIAIHEHDDSVDPETGEARSMERLRFYGRTEWRLFERESSTTNRPAGFVQINDAADLIKSASEARLQQDPDRPWKEIDSGPNMLGIVPLVTINVESAGPDPFHASPPMMDLGWKNVEDWQASSDYSNLLRYGGAPVLVGKGLDSTEQPLRLGAGAQVLNRSEHASVGFVEPSGASFAALRQRLLDLRAEEQMLGMAPLIINKSNRTATGEAIDEVQEQAQAQTWVERLEWGLFRAYEMAAMWLDPRAGNPLPESFDVDVFRDFGLVARSKQDLEMLDRARARKDLSRETYWRELRKRGTLGDEFDEESEVALLESEAEAGAALFMQQQVPAADEPEDDDATTDESEGDDQ